MVASSRINGRATNKEPVITCSKYPCSRSCAYCGQVFDLPTIGLHLLPTTFLMEEAKTMTKKTLAALAITGLFSQTVLAGPTLLTLGAPSCGKWTVEAKNESAIGLAHGFWLTGYLSGASYGSQRDILKDKPDKEGLMLWIGNYCQKNPLASVTDAAQELIRELVKKNNQ